MASVTASSSSLLSRGVPGYDGVAISSALSNNNLSVEEKMRVIGRAFQAGAGMFAYLFEQNECLKDICNGLEEENHQLQLSQDELKKENGLLKEGISSLAAWKEKRNLERKSKIDKKASEQIGKARDLHEAILLMQISTFPISIASAVGASVNPLIGLGIPLACSFNLPADYAREKLNKSMWIMETFPESAMDPEIYKEASKICESKFREDMTHALNLRKIELDYDPDGELADQKISALTFFEGAQKDLEKENKRYADALKPIEAEIAALQEEGEGFQFGAFDFFSGDGGEGGGVFGGLLGYGAVGAEEGEGADDDDGDDDIKGSLVFSKEM